MKWCCERGLNSRPHPYQGCALPLSYHSILFQVVTLGRGPWQRVLEYPFYFSAFSGLDFLSHGQAHKGTTVARDVKGLLPQARASASVLVGQFLGKTAAGPQMVSGAPKDRDGPKAIAGQVLRHGLCHGGQRMWPGMARWATGAAEPRLWRLIHWTCVQRWLKSNPWQRPTKVAQPGTNG